MVKKKKKKKKFPTHFLLPLVNCSLWSLWSRSGVSVINNSVSGIRSFNFRFSGKGQEQWGTRSHSWGAMRGVVIWQWALSLLKAPLAPSPYLLYLSIGTIPSVASSSTSDTRPCCCQKHLNVETLVARDWGGAGEAQLFFVAFSVLYMLFWSSSWRQPRQTLHRQTHSHTKLNSYMVAKYFTGTTLIWQGLFTTSSEVHACSVFIQGGFLVYLLLLFYSADLTW